MSNVDLVRAWKDEDYLTELSQEEQSLVPENPAGMIELTDDELGGIDGATGELLSVLDCPNSLLLFCETYCFCIPNPIEILFR